MACFIAPLVEAIAVTAIRKSGLKGNSPYLQHLPDLEKMLWGGTLMLIVDHIINGELTWTFPFFTSLGQTGGAAILWREVLTVGVPMALALTAAWGIWVALKSHSKSYI
jgi:hypothetical protein